MQRQITTHLPRPNPASQAGPTLLEHLPMVRTQARRIHGRLPQNVEMDDLFSAGLVGLMEASVRFNPAKEVGFVSYAKFRVRGAILDSLRLVDWAPRELRRKGRAIQEAIRILTLRLGHAPVEDEVASEMKISLRVYQKLLGDLNNLEIGSLHRQVGDGSGDEVLVYVPGKPEDDPLFRSMQGQIAKRLTDAISDLPDRERQVTTLYYYEEMTMSEIGLALGLDGSRISQIRSSAVLHLRSALADIPSRAAENLTCLRSMTARTAERPRLTRSAA